MAKNEEVRVSMRYDDMNESGGIMPADGRYVIKSCGFEQSDYGKTDTANKYNLFRLTLVGVDAKNKPIAAKEPHIQYYSYGSTEVFRPSKDGLHVVLVDPNNAKGINKNSLFAVFIREAKNQGFDDETLDNGCDKAFNGIVAEMHSIAAPDYGDIPDKSVAVAGTNPNAGKKKFDKKVFVISEILVNPSEEEAPKAAAKSKKGPEVEDEPDEEPKKGNKADGDGKDSTKKVAQSALKATMKGKDTMDLSALRTTAYRALKATNDADVAAAVHSKWKDDDTLKAWLGEIGFTVDADDEVGEE